MKIIVVDLDDTIFKTQAFKEECLVKFFGVPWDEFKEAYESHKAENGGKFIPEKLLDAYGLDLTEFNDYVAQHINEFLKLGAEKFLSVLKGNCDKLVLASFGDFKFQNLKIEHLKINGVPFRQFFDEVIIEERDKAKNERLIELETLGDEFVVIDDKPEVLESYKKLFGDSGKYILVHKQHSDRVKSEPYEELNQLGREMDPAAYKDESAIKVINEIRLNLM